MYDETLLCAVCSESENVSIFFLDCVKIVSSQTKERVFGETSGKMNGFSIENHDGKNGNHSLAEPISVQWRVFLGSNNKLNSAPNFLCWRN